MTVSIDASLSANSKMPGIPILSIPELDRDPHGIYRRYRADTPFICRPDGSYIAIRGRDVVQLITDPRTRQMESELAVMRGITEGSLFDVLAHSMVFSNGEAHRRRRAAMSRTFAFRIIATLRPRIRALAEELIDAHVEEGRMNLLDDYAGLIPARAIAEILGLPEQDVPYFASLVYTVSRATSFSFTAVEVPAMKQAAEQLNDYAEKMLADRRAAPRDDFLSAFVRAVDEQVELSPVETLSQIVTLIVAGSDTTRAAMAVQVALLLQHREQWNMVCNTPALIPGAVAEALRYEPAVGSVPRFTTAEIEIDGRIAPAGRILTLSTLSAMRDPALYTDPERFDIRRTDHPRWHLVFGGGAHRCLGEALAKAELEEGLAALAARLPQLVADGEPLRVEGHSGIRRLSSLHVAWLR